MTYQFSKCINRLNTQSIKWNVHKSELPMWVADMDFETAPEIIEALHQRVHHGVFGYNDVSEEYFKTIQEWWKDKHSFEFDIDWMMFCTGVVPAISSIIRKLTTVGENVLIQSPVYNIFYNSILNNGRNVLSSDLIYDGKDYSIDFDDLERKLSLPQTTLMILCNPHNPIGKIWDSETLKKIGDLCAQYHVVVISDEIHCDIVSPRYEYIPFASVSQTNLNNCITCVSVTKAFNLAGLQTACIIVANDELRHKVNRGINTDEVAEPNSFALTATVSALNKGGEWLKQLNSYIDDNRNIAIQYIKEKIPEIYVIESKATYLLWIDCSKICLDSEELTQLIRARTGLYVSSGKEYGANGQGFIRMNIACPLERLRDGLERLGRGIYYYRDSFELDESLLDKIHQYEDVMNIELLYQKDIKQIMMQYIYQKQIKMKQVIESQDFILNQEEIEIIDSIIKCYQ